MSMQVILSKINQLFVDSFPDKKFKTKVYPITSRVSAVVQWESDNINYYAEIMFTRQMGKHNLSIIVHADGIEHNEPIAKRTLRKRNITNHTEFYNKHIERLWVIVKVAENDAQDVLGSSKLAMEMKMANDKNVKILNDAGFDIQFGGSYETINGISTNTSVKDDGIKFEVSSEDPNFIIYMRQCVENYKK